MIFNPLYKPNQLIVGKGNVAVCTGWTVRQTIAKHFEPSEFSVIGNLYSPTRGINFLVRNLLANPHVRFLVILNATKEDAVAGACECLLDFFRNGFEAGTGDTKRPCWVIKSPIAGYIDKEIDSLALEKLRQSVEWQETPSIAEAKAQVKSYAQRGVVEPWGSPLEFQLPKVVPTVLPGPRYGHRIEGKTIAETWVKIIHRIKTTGTIRPTGYDGQWQELIDLVAVVTNEPQGFYFPQPNYLPVNRPFIEDYIAQILDDAPYREGLKYTYGQRLRSWFGRDQIEQVMEKLIGEIDAASAVMSLWDVKDHEKGGSPCLNHIWVRVVDNELSLTATLRSNDMFAAWPANAFGLRALQQYIRDEIQLRSSYDLRMGPLITMSQSAHIYDDTFEFVQFVLDNHYEQVSNQRDYTDPCGNFLVSVDDQKILVEQTTPGSGEVVRSFSGSTAQSLYRLISLQVPHIISEHAMYLGTELQKAEIAIKNNFKYEQDRPLGYSKSR